MDSRTLDIIFYYTKMWFNRLTIFLMIVFMFPSSAILLTWNTLPGEGLYPVKLYLEDVALKVVGDNYSVSSDLQTAFVDSRFNEAETLLAESSGDGLDGLAKQVQIAQVEIVKGQADPVKVNQVVVETKAVKLAQKLEEYDAKLEKETINIINNPIDPTNPVPLSDTTISNESLALVNPNVVASAISTATTAITAAPVTVPSTVPATVPTPTPTPVIVSTPTPTSKPISTTTTQTTATSTTTSTTNPKDRHTKPPRHREGRDDGDDDDKHKVEKIENCRREIKTAIKELDKVSRRHEDDREDHDKKENKNNRGNEDKKDNKKDDKALVRKRNAPLAGKMPGLGGVHESSSFVPVRAGTVSPASGKGS